MLNYFVEINRIISIVVSNQSGRNNARILRMDVDLCLESRSFLFVIANYGRYLPSFLGVVGRGMSRSDSNICYQYGNMGYIRQNKTLSRILSTLGNEYGTNEHNKL